MTVSTYNPEDVVVTFGGFVLSNWDSVEVTRTAPAFRIIKGIRGKAARVRTLDTTAQVTLTLPSTSNANSVLAEIAEQDYVSGNGRIEMTIKDVSGFEVFSTPDAFIEKQADRNYGKDMPTRTWIIHCLSSSMAQSSTADITSIFNL
jgi:hypothetical protein